MHAITDCCQALGPTVSLDSGSEPCLQRSALMAMSTGPSWDSRMDVAQRSSVDGVGTSLARSICPLISVLPSCALVMIIRVATIDHCYHASPVNVSCLPRMSKETLDITV